MADEATNPIQQIPEFIRDVFYPSPLSSFRETMPTGEIDVWLHRQPGEEPTKLRLINMFPFMTLKDIKLAIYIELKREAHAIPEFMYICLQQNGPGAKPFLGGQVAPLDFSWNFPSVSVDHPFRTLNPIKLASGSIPVDDRFVDSGGDRRLVAFVDRERMTIEDACFKKGVTKGIPPIHAYLYKDLLAMIPGAKPPSERDWNGRLYQMFPHLSVATAEATEEQKAVADRLATVFLRRQQFLVRIESILEREVPLISLNMAGIKYLQLTWAAKQKIQGIESQFYDAEVNDRRPFIRLIPIEGSGISKVFLHDGKSPDIQDPKLLVQWSQERSPTPEQDFVFAKIMLRKGLFNVPPIYATLRLFNDGTADCVVEPPKGMKKLEPRDDLSSFGEHLIEGLQDLPYITTMPEIGKGLFVLGIRVRKGDDAIITPRILRERLPIFSSMFQEILPLPGEKPMVMLRFKLVSNFAREDRIQTFLTQVIQRKVVRGEGGIADLVNLVADEFMIDQDEARRQVSIKLQNQGEVALVVPESREYMRQNNTGIDVAIFAQHPFYTFHINNVNSLENLRRIVTALSILMSADSTDLQVSEKSVRELIKAEGSSEMEDAPAVEEAPLAADAPVAAAEVAPLPAVDDDAAGAEDLPDYLDFFAFEKDDTEMTLEQAHEEEVAAAAQIEGEARPDPFAVNAAPIQTSQDLRKELAATVVAPKEELTGIPLATRTEAAAENENTAATGETGIANFFLTKLKEADSRLFDYTKANPSLKRYVSQCQPTYGRQHAVLSEEKFIEIQEEYAKDSITFQVYPLQPGEPTKPDGVPERDYYTVLKYGSSPQRQHYYLCCRYFCTRDEMLVRDVDLQGEVMRRPTRRADGTVDTAKNPGECPFCRGRIIRNRRNPGPRETILERVIKPPTQDKRHLFIGFIKKTPHPEGFYLPCCFTEDIPIRFKDNPAFDKYREWGIVPKSNIRPTTAAAEEALEDEEDITEPTYVDPRAIVDYTTILNQIASKYIVGTEKLPLDIGTVASGTRGEAQIGLLPIILNSYFDQDPAQLVSRTSNPQKLQIGAKGFMRIGVENRHRFQNDSFLAAVAPFYKKSTAEQMKEHILESIQPKEFLALNYGNLAIEFYDPGDSVIKRPTIEALRLWASKFLQVDIQQENEESVMRAYISYNTFQEWLLSDKTKKEYRQFALLFAQSNILRKVSPSGLTFIVLDILKDGKMNVRCPPYGYNSGLMNKNDVAFILHHWSGIWEPIFYVEDQSVEFSADRREKRKTSFTLEFQYTGREAWPPIVQQRLGEFMGQCSSSGRAIYTSQSKMNALAMIPASLARNTLVQDKNIIFDGVLRDAYNHIGALLFREKSDDLGRVIALPVADDGELIIGKNLILDWEDPSFRPAAIENVLLFYKKYIEPRFAFYPGFSPVTIIKSAVTGTIEAVQLKNGLYVPVAPPSTEAAAKQLEGSPTRTVTELEWSKNHEICLEEKGSALPGEKSRMDTAEFQEIFEHLRLTFSNWLASKEDGGEFRNRIEEVIFSRRLPLFERRKRMEILLGREVEKWITSDFADEDTPSIKDVSLMRVDCTVRDKMGCGGRCVWKQDEGHGKCLLHVPEETQLGEQEKYVSAPRVLLLRLIEELLRYGERRRQLLEKGVSRLASMEHPITIPVAGTPSKQVIYPEKSSAWYELLRLEWARTFNEEPRFTEEMSREQGVSSELAAVDEDTLLPPRLQTILNGPAGMDPKTGAIRLLRAPLQAFLIPLRMTPIEVSINEDTDILTPTMIRKIVLKTGYNLLQIDLREDPPVFTAGRSSRKVIEEKATIVLVITEEGPGLLVLDPSTPEILKKKDMPAGLLEVIEKTVESKPPVAAWTMAEAQQEARAKKEKAKIAQPPAPPLPPAAAPPPSP